MKRNLILALAGLFVLTGCRHYVMEERVYTAPKGTEGETVKQVPPATEELPSIAPEKTPATQQPQQKPQGAKFAPMEQLDSDKIVGIESTGKKGRRAVRKHAAAPGGTYIVKPGDTLGSIARIHHVRLSALMSANHLTQKDARSLRVGRKLVIPSGGKTAFSKSGKTRRGFSGASTTPTGSLLNPDGTYTVRAGDSIPKIARRLKIKARDLQKANNLSDAATRRLQIGQKLVLPGSTATLSTATAPAATAPIDVKVAPAENSPTESASATETVKVVKPVESAPATTVKTETETRLYTVEKDMTLAELAKQEGTTVKELRAINPSLQEDGNLKIDDMVFVPIKSAK